MPSAPPRPGSSRRCTTRMSGSRWSASTARRPRWPAPGHDARVPTEIPRTIHPIPTARQGGTRAGLAGPRRRPRPPGCAQGGPPRTGGRPLRRRPASSRKPGSRASSNIPGSSRSTNWPSGPPTDTLSTRCGSSTAGRSPTRSKTTTIGAKPAGRPARPPSLLNAFAGSATRWRTPIAAGDPPRPQGAERRTGRLRRGDRPRLGPGQDRRPRRGAGPAAIDRGGADRRHDARPGQILGTPAYMPPEQAEGRLDRSTGGATSTASAPSSTRS